jgi:hypothetical protein
MVQANALLPVMVLAVAWAWVTWLGKATGWWRCPSPSTRVVAGVCAGLLITFTVLRNLPGLAFLAPPALA